MMTLIKENLVPIIIIFIAAAIVSLAVLPLENTSWADGFRPDTQQEDATETNEAEAAPGGIASYIGPLIKVTILMGIGAFFTWLIPLIIRQMSPVFSKEKQTIDPNR